MFPCRLIVDPPQEGDWNMAVDEALLEDAADRNATTLRFYRWDEPTLSLGYFQAFAERDAHSASRGVAAVRRLSGGGALLHDRELTYSLCLAASHPLARQAPAVYGRMHEALLAALASFGVRAELWGAVAGAGRLSPDAAEPFLCFSRRTATDVVVPASSGEVGGRSTIKLAGSAQRRRRGAILQHGALLLAASPAAPELSGVLEATGVLLNPTELAAAWADAARSELGLELQPASLDPALLREAELLRNSRYAGELWTARR